MYDFVVVGAGPAGSRFAHRAAEGGYDVLALEQGSVGEPLACSGHVSTDVWEYTTEGAREDLLQNEITGARFHVGGPESEAHPFYTDDPISNVIDRVGLDEHLAAAAREAGADLREHHTVTDVSEEPDHVLVSASTPEGSAQFRARMVAGCDGPVSRTRRDLDIEEPDELLHGVLGFDPTPDHGDRVDVHLTVPRFFAWRIPRGEAGVEYGLAAPPGREVRGLFEEFTAGYGVETENVCSGMIPIGPPERITSDRGFLLGDAAAQTKPFTGGGILYGMTAADHAADTVDPENPKTLQRYEKTWRSDLAREIRLGGVLRRAYSLPKPIQNAGLGALSGEIGVHMDRPTSLFSRAQLKALLSRS
ncbi:geranylgeranyl reductase family protein [Halalkalicoccus jeotgali]|uniref:Geranylgeranyl hydrogenase n=1 Tax=Halalkalicoccus jeotgali (strain DSM 18796 / CECT 7217 / JCM 14584 / KCTC 4019 / B3) TaxID=795797 RepID=D8J7S5_HALJB|nr:geranylgeranyl reductase family protein [Halalkalicoccus jeotgali]ADJ16095.1 geranylgeranyl hydrogenase [Halalkalicoccus jeotgali B3]ELY38190.1 geranylgeranyl hydrogenase [Halalkalicoccus jeotgali B3]